jgi:adenylosuccinate synthase
VVGGGVVLDPQAFLEECASLEKAGVEIRGRLFVSTRCHLILPTIGRSKLPQRNSWARENWYHGARNRSCLRGQVWRRGLRVCDLLDTATFPDKLRTQVDLKNRALEALHSDERVDAESIRQAYEKFAEKLRPLVVDTASFVNRLLRDGKSVLFEGAQATLLDIDHGTFPS